jgi:hypothetical protein
VVNAAANTASGGLIEWCVEATDGTDMQITCGTVGFTCTNKAGTMTANTGVVLAAATGVTSQIVTAGTQAVTFPTTTGAALCNIQVNTNSAVLVPTTMRMTYNLHNLGQQTMVPQ